MPGGDRTGPMGMGPMTGRGAGYCGGSPAPGFMNRGFGGGGFGGGGFGRGRGRGGGWGWRNWSYAAGMPGWPRAAMAGPWGGAYAQPFVPWGGAYAQPFVPTTAAGAQELDALHSQAEYLAGTLEEVKNRIDQLEKQSRAQA